MFRKFSFCFGVLIILSISTVFSQSTSLRDGIELFRIGKYDEAITVFKHEIERDSLKKTPYIYLSAAYLEREFPVLAGHVAEKGENLFKEEAGFLWLKAEALLHQKLPHKAIEIYSRIFRNYESLRFSDILGITDSKLRRRWIEAELAVSSMAYQNGDFEGALQAIENVLRLNSDHLQAEKNRIYLHIEQENWQQVIHYTTKALEKYPEDADIIRMKATAHYHVEDSEALLAEYQKFYNKNPEDIDTAIIYADILLVNQKGAEAEQVFVKLLEQFPENKKIYREFARLHERRMYFQAKASVIELMLEKFPDDEEAYTDLAETYELEQEWNKARNAYERLTAVNGNNTDTREKIARTYYKEGNFADAEKVLYTILTTHPENTSTIIYLGNILQEQQKWEESLSVLNKLPKEQKLAAPGIKIGLAHYRLKDYTASKHILSRILENSESEPLAWLLLAKIEEPVNTQKALEWTVKAVNLSFDKLSAQQSDVQKEFNEQGLGTQYKADSGGFEEYADIAEQSIHFLTRSFTGKKVEPLLDELTKEYSDSPNLLYQAAGFFVETEKYAKAKNLLGKTLQLNSSFFEAHFLFATILERENNYPEASLFYERALSADPESDKAYKAIIRTYQHQDKLDELAEKWKVRHRVEKENQQLLGYLIEILHKTDRFEEAGELLAQ